MSEEEVRRLKILIKEDNVDELSNILNSNDNLRNNFNMFLSSKNPTFTQMPLLHFAVQEKSQKVVEYLLSQDFVDKTICNFNGENIYHIICRIRGAEELFSIIEKKVPHHLLLDNSHHLLSGKRVFLIACKLNNIFIVKRIHEILESSQVDLTPIKKRALKYAINNQDIEVIKYILSIDGIQLNDDILFRALGYSKFEVVVYLLNIYLCHSIPSHLHNQFHIFQFSNLPSNHNDNNNNYNNGKNNNNNNNYGIQQNNKPVDSQNEEEIQDEFQSHPKKILKRERDNNNDSVINHNKKRKISKVVFNDDINIIYDNDYYLKIVEENFTRIYEKELFSFKFRIWHEVCRNANLDVVQLIFSLKGIQPEILSKSGYNVFLIACEFNSNIKVIKYIHKLFPSFINTQINLGGILNGAYLVIYNSYLDNFQLDKREKLNFLHYLYLNGIDIHFISKIEYLDHKIYQSLYSISKEDEIYDENLAQYLKVISQDFDYLHNEHDHEVYRKPSFWKQFHNNNNNNNNNNIGEKSKGVHEWKNRFDEHVLHKLSKMIQQHMLEPNDTNQTL